IFAGVGYCQSAHPLKTMKDYANLIKRSDGFGKCLKSVELTMAEGINQNIVLPSPLAKKLAPQFSAHVVNKAEEALFWRPINNFPDSFTAA
ncbi:DUF885 domain-containing protein, partial [Pseudoalteromonas sp. S186]